MKIFQSYFAVTENYRSKFFINRVALIERSGAEYKIIREIRVSANIHQDHA